MWVWWRKRGDRGRKRRIRGDRDCNNWPVSSSPKVVFPTHQKLCFLLTKCCVSYSPNAVFPTHQMLCFLLTICRVSYSHFDLFPTHILTCFLLTKWCVSYSQNGVFPTRFLLVSYSFPTRFLLVSYSHFVSRKPTFSPGSSPFTRGSC